MPLFSFFLFYPMKISAFDKYYMAIYGSKIYVSQI